MRFTGKRQMHKKIAEALTVTHFRSYKTIFDSDVKAVMSAHPIKPMPQSNLLSEYTCCLRLFLNFRCVPDEYELAKEHTTKRLSKFLYLEIEALADEALTQLYARDSQGIKETLLKIIDECHGGM
jgi:hypothetical protein